MAKSHQGIKDKQKRQSRPVTAKLVHDQADLTSQFDLPDGLIGVVDGDAMQAQATRLGDPSMQIAQRQALAAQIERVGGNRYLQRLVTSVNGAGKTAYGGVTTLSTASLDLANGYAREGLLQCRRRRRRRGLASVPVKKRKKLSVPSADSIILSPATVDKYFKKIPSGEWDTKPSLPKKVGIKFNGIARKYHTPMTSIAQEVASRHYKSPLTKRQLPILGPNNTVTVHLDLKKHGLADGSYRFSMIGDFRRGTIYVESLAGGPKEEHSPTVSAGVITLGRLKFKYDSSWSRDYLPHLRKALALTPHKALKQVNGLEFSIIGGRGPTGKGGRYLEDEHKVLIYSSAFDKFSIRYGVSPWAVQAIVHEIGHAVDYAPLRKAWKKYQSTRSERHLTKAKGESGMKWALVGQEWDTIEYITKRDSAFRKAAYRDGLKLTRGRKIVGGVTDYANKNWKDLYAESFALYMTDPKTLKLIRPNIYKYFKRRLPSRKK